MTKINKLSALALFLASTSAFATTYEVDASHSKVGFEVPHLVISTVEGRFNKFSGKVDLADKFEKSKFEMKVDVASVDTGVAKRDDHLRAADFFESGKYPEMKFVSTEVKGKPEGFELIGNLTIKGVTRKVTFKSKYLGKVKDGFGKERTAFQAKSKINRKDFGLNFASMMEKGPVVGDEVEIDLKVEATH